MKLIIIISILLSIFLHASNVDWSANIRFRYRNDTSNDIEDGVYSSLSEARSRLGLRILGKNASANFVLQDSRIFGERSPSENKVFFNQAYIHFRIKRNLIQLGRFELPLGKQRLIAKRNWNNTGLSFDGFLIKRRTNLWQFTFLNLVINENINLYHDNNFDTRLRGGYLTLNQKLFSRVLASELYLFNYRDNISIYNSKPLLSGGIRLELYLIGPISYEGELALQTGENISSYMISANIFLKRKEKRFFNKVSIGFEYITGNDSTKLSNNAFSKLFGSSHKYHGFYDYALHKNFTDHEHRGLIEFNIKGKTNFLLNTNLLISYHSFYSQVSEDHYGNELDFFLIKTLSDEINFSAGLSFYKPALENKILFLNYLIITVNLP